MLRIKYSWMNIELLLVSWLTKFGFYSETTDENSKLNHTTPQIKPYSMQKKLYFEAVLIFFWLEKYVKISFEMSSHRTQATSMNLLF